MEYSSGEEMLRASIEKLIESLGPSRREEALRFAASVIDILRATTGGAGPTPVLTGQGQGAPTICPKCNSPITVVLR
jgi:hypothetical protein